MRIVEGTARNMGIAVEGFGSSSDEKVEENSEA